jgi:hypothetical protein
VAVSSRKACATMLLIAVLGITGCGELGTTWKGDRLVRPHAVSSVEVQRYPAGSPERAFLLWFSALQRMDAASYARWFAPSLAVDAAAVRRFWRAQPARIDASPQVTDVVRRGRTATVYVRLTTRYAAPNGRTIVFRGIDGVSFVLGRGGWRLADPLVTSRLLAAQGAQRRRIASENL